MSSGSDALHIGFVFYDFSDSRAIDVIRGLSQCLGIDRVSFFPAGPLNSPTEVTENNRVKVLDALKSTKLDGLITLQFWESESWYRLMLFDGLPYPVVPLLRSYPDSPGITSPYNQGSYEAVNHLIQTHGCRKPYYLIGSSGNSINLDERFRGYLRALEDAGIEYTNSMRISLQGSFSTGGLVSGAAHQGGEAVDTLFKKRGLIPGEDVDALVIFNDKMALEVMESLSKEGIRVPEDVCILSFDNTAESETSNPPLTTSAIDWQTLGIEGLKLLRNIIAGEQPNTGVEITPSLIVRNSCGCFNPVDRLLNEDVDALGAEKKLALYQQITHDYHATRHTMTASANSYRDSSILRNAAVMLAKCNDLDSFADAYTLLLSYLNLCECSIYLADNNFKGHYSRHLHWSDHCKTYTFTNESVAIDSFAQFMGEFPVSVCESLDQGEKHIGFLVFGAQDSNFVSFGELRDLLSSTLNSLLLIENLQETQHQLRIVQQEKLTSQGRLVAGIAHDVNTPLGIGVTASSNLMTETQDLKQKFEDGVLGKQAFLDAIKSITESSEIVQKNLKRADELIKSFKNISVKSGSDTIQIFDLKEHLQDIIFTMKPMLTKRKIAVELNCDASLELNSNPGLLSQIFVNLINNSAKHGYANNQGGTIKLTVSPHTSEELLLSYCDDGLGMDKEILDKIYEPFFTTKGKDGGSGLGMFIVFNMVTQKLNGRLEIESAPGKGVKIDIYLPI